MKFITNNSSHFAVHVGFKEKYVEKMVATKLLGLQIDNHLNYKNHNEKMLPKLNAACYAIMSLVHSNINTFKSIYYAHFLSSIKYGIILGGNSPNSGKNFTLQDKIVRIMVGA